MKELVKKYDRQGPRYTSYPPVPFWKGAPTEREWLKEINSSLEKHPRMDVYIHVPFCEKLCYYCGCHRVITKDKTRGTDYVDQLIKEWQLYLVNITTPFKLHSLHLGGGTPTFLTPEDLTRLLTEMRPHFADDFIGAIEVDPRTCQIEHLKILKAFGFNRISLGIQDFDAEVQKKINREQPYSMVKSLVEKLRELQFKAINFDLIYGLPGQSHKTVTQTLDAVMELAPDTIAFYSYAHLPDRLPNQRLIKESDLLLAEDKLDLYLTGLEHLQTHGFQHIGMDHFAKKGSFLDGKITRSFMGYTDEKTDLLLGLGVSAIGQSENMFAQNDKTVDQYKARLASNSLPLSHGHTLAAQEKEVAQQIQDIFCSGEISFGTEFAHELQSRTEIQELKADGLVSWEGATLRVTHLGRKFLRNIAMAIDPLLKDGSEKRFSRTI